MKKLSLILLALLSFSLWASNAQENISPANALERYLDNGDATRGWEVRDSYSVNGVDTYSLLLISQKWQGMLWKHELIIHVPAEVRYDGALLFIEGGGIDDGIPSFTGRDSKTSQFMAIIAERNKAVVAILRQVPNQPLYGGLKEDALISYTLNEFRKDGDYSWPLLFPMVKSAVRAMDAVQEFAREHTGNEISGFIISGASKRGWTTWLTGASRDPRVLAIAPMVIDMLNMPVSLDYQKTLYGEYSEEIGDYVRLDIPQAIHSEFGRAVVDMIDPYSYRRNLTMPKMIFMGTNDPYWTLDAVKHYIDDIPGENMLHYVPNAGHGLGDKTQAMNALSSFVALTLNKAAYPVSAWEVVEKGKNITLKVNVLPEGLVGAKLWRASFDTRDFRNAEWSSSDITLAQGARQVTAELAYPRKGFEAFYIDLVYRDPLGNDFTVSTRTFVADSRQVFID